MGTIEDFEDRRESAALSNLLNIMAGDPRLELGASDSGADLDE
jgi:hypothetical protein